MGKIVRLATAVIAAALLSAIGPAWAEDAEHIRHLMMSTFHTADNPLSIDPVTVYKNIAVAGWSQGDMGGRALLRRKEGAWKLILCSGDALKQAKALEHFGLSSDQAEAMAAAVVEAESQLDPALVAKFEAFDGLVMMDGDGNHPPAHSPGNSTRHGG